MIGTLAGGERLLAAGSRRQGLGGGHAAGVLQGLRRRADEGQHQDADLNAGTILVPSSNIALLPSPWYQL